MRIKNRDPRLCRRLPIAAVLGIVLTTMAAAQEPPPPAPPAPGSNPPGAGAVLPAELMDRFRRMEEANRKLLQRVDDLSQQNQRLTRQVQDLSKKFADGAQSDDSAQGADKPSRPKPSGIANQVAGQPPEAARTPDAIRAPSMEESGARSAGARLLPGAQGVGNRYLSKIPLKGFFDYGRDGVGFATDDDEFLLKFRAMLQVDALDYTGPHGSPTNSGFYLPRVRYYFQGHYTRPIDYQISFQRSETSNLNFLNVFLNFNYDPRFQFRIGRFKVPYLYEWYKLNSWRFITPERSLFGANFGLNRQVGAMEWGELFQDRMEYAVGIFDGPRNSFADSNYAKDVMAFINFRPFGNRTGSVLQNFNFGGSVDYGRQDNPLSPAVLRTNANASSDTLTNSDPINNTTVPFLAFNNGVTERGPRELWDLHLAYFYKGLSLIGEWSSGYDSFARSDKSNPVALPVQGYYVEASYLVTGETLNERTIIDPIHRFDLRRGRFGLGALEPFVRYSELNVGNQVFTGGLADPNLWTNRAQLIDVGANWYLNRAIKFYLDWEHAIFAQPVLYAPGLLRRTNDLFWLRFQIYF